MNRNLSKLGANIRNYIHLNKELILDGVGKLYVYREAASLSTNLNMLRPSATKIVFSSITQGNLTHTPYEFSGFRSELIKALQDEGHYKVPGLGRFFNKNGQVEFSEEKGMSANVGLPALELTPLNLAVSERPQLKADKVTESGAPSRNNERRFLLGTAAAAAIFILCIFSFHYFTYSTPESNSNELTYDVDKSRLNQSPESLMVSAEIEPEFIPGIVEERQVAKCALIVGSFSQMQNASEMQQRVLAEGYDLYTEEFHEFYRVGVRMDCSEIKGATFREIENALGVDPWLHISLPN